MEQDDGVETKMDGRKWKERRKGVTASSCVDADRRKGCHSVACAEKGPRVVKERKHAQLSGAKNGLMGERRVQRPTEISLKL